MLWQEWTITVPLFFVLSGRVLTASPLRKNLTGPIASSALRRPFRLVLPVIGVMIVGWIMFQLGLFDSVCPNSDQSFCPGPDKVPGSFFDLFVRPFLYITNTAGLLPTTFSPKPLPYTAWTLPLEYANSNYVYLLSFILVEFKNQTMVRYSILLGALICTLYTHLWTAHFIVGVIFAELSNNGTLEKIKSHKWTPVINVVLFLVGIFFCVGTSITIGAQTEQWVKYLQVNYYFQFGNWDGYMEEKPMVLLLSAILMFIVETSNFWQKVLGAKVFVFLGRISYTLYLFHPYFNYSIQPLLMKLIDPNSLHGKILLFIICSILVCICSELLVIIIDEPSMKLTNMVYKKLTTWKTNSSNSTADLVAIEISKEDIEEPNGNVDASSTPLKEEP
ncbi:hypothetical protein HDV02_006628 [Globomyces sp. JEL0801]|nr:hypothetical protein HDV02_006628 [Globomyces sp. JEL0801]